MAIRGMSIWCLFVIVIAVLMLNQRGAEGRKSWSELQRAVSSGKQPRSPKVVGSKVKKQANSKASSRSAACRRRKARPARKISLAKPKPSLAVRAGNIIQKLPDYTEKAIFGLHALLDLTNKGIDTVYEGVETARDIQQVVKNDDGTIILELLKRNPKIRHIDNRLTEIKQRVGKFKRNANVPAKIDRAEKSISEKNVPQATNVNVDKIDLLAQLLKDPAILQHLSDRFKSPVDGNIGSKCEKKGSDNLSSIGDQLDEMKNVKDEVPNVAKNEVPNVVKDEVPNVVKNEMPNVVKNEMPNVVKNEMPNVVKNEMPNVVKNEMPNVVKNEASCKLPSPTNDEGYESASSDKEFDDDSSFLSSEDIDESSEEMDDIKEQLNENEKPAVAA